LVMFDEAAMAEHAVGTRSSAKKRVPTGFVREVPPPEEEPSAGRQYLQFGGEEVNEGLGTRSTNKKRVPTAFVREPIPVEDDEDLQKHRLAFEETDGLGTRSTNKKRTPTACVKNAASDDEEEDEEEEVGAMTTISSGRMNFTVRDSAAGTRSTNKQRKPTAFIRPNVFPPEDIGASVNFGGLEVEQGVGTRSTNKKRTPTAFVRVVPEAEEDEEVQELQRHQVDAIPQANAIQANHINGDIEPAQVAQVAAPAAAATEESAAAAADDNGRRQRRCRIPTNQLT